ncbi:MAG: RNA-binding domain-containing protein [bacterium]
MTDVELNIILQNLLTIDENEIVEFKEAKNNFDFNKLGKYFSALSNEANLFKKEEAWLVFGVSDKKTIVGTSFRSSLKELHNLKKEIALKTSGNLTFIDIFPIETANGRVILFQIPAAPKGLPVTWEGHYYGRNGEALSPLNIDEIEKIRSQVVYYDWSAEIVKDASLDDLDLKALDKARHNFIERNPHLYDDIAQWDTITFLNKAKVTIKGMITRTAILLLGKSESEHLLSPADAKMRWILKNAKNQERDWHIFNIPFLLSVEELYGKIRNLKYQYMNQVSVFPQEVLRYEPFTIREAINNCIAHQDYTLSGRINVIENENDELIFTNLGTFLPSNIESVVLGNAPQERYRNRFLVEAMVNLKMVESIGSGIRKMFEYQKLRFFPLPEYNLTDQRVELKIIGKIIDIEFAKILSLNQNLNLQEIMLLDKVQKGKTISDAEFKHLKSNNLIEGRRPNIYISSTVVTPLTDDLKTQYINQKAFDDEHYKKMIIRYLEKFSFADRKTIEKLLINKLPSILSDKQKQNKITNIIASLRRSGIINNEGSKKAPKWILLQINYK